MQPRDATGHAQGDAHHLSTTNVPHVVAAQPSGNTAPTPPIIRTPDQRVRVFVSSTLEELAPERAAAHAAITQLHLIPVQFESGARPHPPRDLYRAYLAQSAIFVGIYWQRYGWVAPGMTVSGLEDEYLLAQGKPKLIYLKAPAPTREPRLHDLLERVRNENVACYRRFSRAEELQELLQDDLAILLTEYFEQARPSSGANTSAAETRDFPTGTVTFLVTDIAGSTRLVHQLGAERYAAAHADSCRLVRAAVAAHGGREVDMAGDRFFLAFARAPDAVAAAADAQQRMAAHPWTEGAALRMRMALHTGTAHVTGRSYEGLEAHRAALMVAAAQGGQLLLSDATRTLVEHELPAGASLRDQGLCRLKGLEQPEHLWQLVLPNLPTDFPPLNTLDAHPHNLPIQPTLLLGREREVADVCVLLCRHNARLLTLTGPGGVGKTRVGLQVAAELVSDFADGVWFVALSHLTDPTLVLPTIAHTLHLQEMDSQPMAAMLRAHLTDKRLLLVLDNFEQVVGAAGEVARLLEASPGLRVLVTSRLPLRLRGEREYPLPPLRLPDLHHLPNGDELSQYAAVALFIERAQAAQADFAVTSATAQAVAEICSRLDGLPLAIELAAARAKLLPPPALLRRLEHALPVLTGGPRDVDERQRTMRNTLAWSYNLLSSEEQRLFRRLAVFVGGCTLETAETVCAAPEGTPPMQLDLLEGLSTLVDHSLVQQRAAADEDGEARFGLLHVIREYALDQLTASGEEEALRRAHAAYCLALGEQAEPALRSAGQQAEEWVRYVGREYDNVRAALTWLRDSGQVTLGLRLAVGIGDFWVANSRFTEGRNWLEGLLVNVPQSEAIGTESPVPAVVQAQARALLGTLEFLLGDDKIAAVQLEAALAMARALGDQRVVVYALGSLADLARVRGEAERAAARYEELALVARQVGGPAAAAQAQDADGLAAYERGEWARAAALLEEQLATHRVRREQDAVGQCLWLMGVVALHQGDPARATGRLQEAVVLAQRLGNQDGLAYVLEGLAWASGAVGRGERAARLLGAAAAQRNALGQARWPHFRNEVEAGVAAVRQALGEERWAAADAAGRALTVDEAVAEALGEAH